MFFLTVRSLHNVALDLEHLGLACNAIPQKHVICWYELVRDQLYRLLAYHPTYVCRSDMQLTTISPYKLLDMLVDAVCRLLADPRMVGFFGCIEKVECPERVYIYVLCLCQRVVDVATAIITVLKPIIVCNEGDVEVDH